MKYIFDIDGTLCHSPKSPETGLPDYNLSTPIVKRIQKVNSLYEDGHTIILFTARGMGRHNNNPILAIQEFYEITANQMKKWGVKYHNLVLGKPNGDFYIDDKGVKDEDFFAD